MSKVTHSITETLIRKKGKVFNSDVQCFLCESKKTQLMYTYLYKGKESYILRCLSCGLLFITPIPLVDKNSRVMDSISDVDFLENGIFSRIKKELIIKKEIRIIKKFLTGSHPSLLDIGCGSGWATAVWKEYGFCVNGLEPSLITSEMGKIKYNIDVFTGSIEEFVPPHTFDVVIMRHVLEHLVNPIEVLTRIKTFMNDGGILLIVVPNIDSIGRYMLQEDWIWGLPRHLHFYNPGSLAKLVEKTGYKKLKLYQTPTPMWYPLGFGAKLQKRSICVPFLKNSSNLLNIIPFIPIVLFGFLFNMSDNIVFIAKKRI